MKIGNEEEPDEKSNLNKPQPDKQPSKRIEKIFDYSKYYVETGARPQNFLKDNKPHERFRDHPKNQELLKLKDDLLKTRNHPPVYIKADIRFPKLTK